MRPPITDYYCNIAYEVSKRSTCLISHYGAVLVKRNKIISTGYNGAAKHTKNCCDVGKCVRDVEGFKRYDLCRAVHAEVNAILVPALDDLVDSVLYIARSYNAPGSTLEVWPCQNCKRLITNAEIAWVICRQDDGYVKTAYPFEWENEI